MESFLFFVFFLGFISLVTGLMVWAYLAEKKRKEELALEATRLGLSYHPQKDYGLASHFQFLNRLRSGDNRYAFDRISGRYRDHQVLVFSYHYETSSTDSKGRRETTHHHLTVYTLSLPRVFPELTIIREDLFSKVAQVFGYDDIDFESHEFSRKFCVRSPDKKFAYDICHARAMEYLLMNTDLNIEIEGSTLAYIFPGKLKKQDLEGSLLRLAGFRNLIPDYVLENIS